MAADRDDARSRRRLRPSRVSNRDTPLASSRAVPLPATIAGLASAPGSGDTVASMSSAARLLVVSPSARRLTARALRPSPTARGFSCPRSIARPRRRNSHEADRSPSPHQEPRDGRRGGHVRPPRRRDPPRLRPAHRLVDPPHPRAPRAGRRPHGVGLRARDRPPRRRDGHERSRGDEHRHAAVRRVHGLGPVRRASPVRCRTR